MATQCALSQHDTNGLPINIGSRQQTSKGQISKTYQCPFGEFELCHHVYQGNEGGNTYCPLEGAARIIVCSTPKFAKMVSQKHSQAGSMQVHRDLYENHGRYISRKYIQDIGNAVGTIAESTHWEYTAEVSEKTVSSIGVSLDGTCMLLREEGWRQAMVGSISLYDKAGERLHTSYLAQPVRHG